jgi:hypothetical protein
MFSVASPVIWEPLLTPQGRGRYLARLLALSSSPGPPGQRHERLWSWPLPYMCCLPSEHKLGGNTNPRRWSNLSSFSHIASLSLEVRFLLLVSSLLVYFKIADQSYCQKPLPVFPMRGKWIVPFEGTFTFLYWANKSGEFLGSTSQSIEYMRHLVDNRRVE